MSKLPISVVIPTYNNTEGLREMVLYLKDIVEEIIVVDNKPDDEKFRISDKYNLIYLPQRENTGFAKAVNLGASQVSSEWLLVLNDDIHFQKSVDLQRLFEFVKAKSWVAGTPLLRSQEGEIENCGYYVKPEGKIRLNYDLSIFDSESLDGITAACMLIQRTEFNELNGFDESFFAYLEDVDLCLRMKRYGYRFGVMTSLEVIHDHQTTSKQMPALKAKRDLINWILLLRRHWGWKQLCRYSPQIVLERMRNVSGYIKQL